MTGKRRRLVIEEYQQDDGTWEEMERLTTSSDKTMAGALRAYADTIDPQDKTLTEEEVNMMKAFGVDLTAFTGKGKV